MMTNIFYIIGFLLGVYGGWNLHKGHIEDMVKRMKEVEQDEREQNTFRPSIHDDKVQVIIKKTDDIFYLYAEDGTFLAQGRSHKEISEKLAVRFPGKSFFGDSSNLKEVDFK